MSALYTTPECGYSTVSSSKLKELEKKGDKQEDKERLKEIKKAEAILLEMERDYLADRVISEVFERRRKQVKEKYSKMAKELEKTNWMYPSIDDILQGKTKL